MKKLLSLLLFISQISSAQKNAEDSIEIRIKKLQGNLYFLDCINGFGGGNVAASIGDEGILLVDNMYAFMGPKLKASLKTISDKPVAIVLNTHFHADHIQGNAGFKKSAVIIAQENVGKRLLQQNSTAYPTADMMPTVIFTDSITIHYNGEDIKIIHYPHCHTDGDAVIFFTKSKVLHLGDMFFFGMFPAVYTEGGGDIKQLIISLEKIIKEIPADAKVIPGHGDPATMKDLSDYVFMLKETVAITEANIRKGKSLDQMKNDKILMKFDTLGSGGAQTTDEYLSMLYKLLKK